MSIHEVASNSVVNQITQKETFAIETGLYLH